MQKYKIRPLNVLHLDPGHKVLWVLDAPRAESVKDMIYDAGFEQWNDSEFYMSNSLDETTTEVRNLPPVW